MRQEIHVFSFIINNVIVEDITNVEISCTRKKSETNK